MDSPAEQAKSICVKVGLNFAEVVEAHLLTGYLFAGPSLFACAKPVPSTAEIRDVWQSWPVAECDAWFVWLAAGSVEKMLPLMPYPLPLVGWHRAGRDWRDNHWVPTGFLQRRFRV